ncbi:hypothetical protein [Mumia sp. Pv 4-285]
MHPWAAYLISRDAIAREERHRRSRTGRRDAPARPTRAMGCAV